MIALCVICCFKHQSSLAMLSHHAILDGWEWAESDIPPKYVLFVSAVSLAWRMPGNATRIWDVCAVKHGEVIAKDICKHTPSRAVRTRWGSISEIGKVCSDGGAVLASVFAQCFSKDLEAKESKASKASKVATSLDDRSTHA